MRLLPHACSVLVRFGERRVDVDSGEDLFSPSPWRSPDELRDRAGVLADVVAPGYVLPGRSELDHAVRLLVGNGKIQSSMP